MTSAEPETCGFCGGPLDGHDLHFRFQFPDVLAERLDAGLDPSQIVGDADHDDVIGLGEHWFSSVVLHGRLANAVPPWGDEVRGATATATALDVDSPPYVTTSDDATLTHVLDDEWSAEVVLAALPH